METNTNIGFEELLKYDKLIKRYVDQVVNKKLEQVIGKTIVTIPQVYTELVYDTSTQSAPIKNVDAVHCTASGDLTGSQAGTYTITFSLNNNTTMVWEDLTSADKVFTWKINKKVLSVPNISLDDDIYNGLVKNLNIEEYNHLLISQTGDSSGTNAGTYNIVFSLIDNVNTNWDDDTITNKTVEWVINKKDPSVYNAAHYNNVTLEINSSTTTRNFWIYSAIQPTVTLTSDNANIVTLVGPTLQSDDTREDENGETIYANKFTLATVDNKLGGGTITFNFAGDSNHLPASFQFKFRCFIPSWSDGSASAIVSALTAHYNDEIDLHNYWEVGDTRRIYLNTIYSDNNLETERQDSQYIDLVILNKGGKELVTPINGHTQCAFIVGQKDMLKTSGKISNYAYSRSWKDMERRTWLNENYKASYPSNIVEIFKQHKNLSYDKSTSSFANTEDYFTLLAEREFKSTSDYLRANPAEPTTITQFAYYAANPVDLESRYFWLRSPYSPNNTSYWLYSNGDYYASSALGIIPIGCI